MHSELYYTRSLSMSRLAIRPDCTHSLPISDNHWRYTTVTRDSDQCIVEVVVLVSNAMNQGSTEMTPRTAGHMIAAIDMYIGMSS